MQTSETLPLKIARARLKIGRDFMRKEIRCGAIKVFKPNARVVMVYVSSIEEYERRKSA